MNNMELVQKEYAYWAQGDIHSMGALFHADILWEDCNGFPFIGGDGSFRGTSAIIEGVLNRMSEQYKAFHIDIQELFAIGEKVVMMGYYKGIFKNTTKSFKANVTHVWSIREEKVTHFFQAVDTAEIITPTVGQEL